MTHVAGAELRGARIRPVGRLHGRGARAVRTVRAPGCVAVAQGQRARGAVGPLRARRGPGHRARRARRERCAALPARERDRAAGGLAPVPAGLAGSGHGAAAAPFLRHPVVELRRAGAHRVGPHEHAQNPPGTDPMNSPARALRARNLGTLAALAALFLVPLVIAFFTYYGSDWRPAGRVNHGVLITPARPLPPVSLPRVSRVAPHGTPFRGKWTLVHAVDGP